jgi:hypothetical protein
MLCGAKLKTGIIMGRVIPEGLRHGVYTADYYCILQNFGANLLPHRSSLNGRINGCKTHSMELLHTFQARRSRISNLTWTGLYWRHSNALIKSFFVNCRPKHSVVRALDSTRRSSLVVFYFGWKGGEHSHSSHCITTLCILVGEGQRFG